MRHAGRTRQKVHAFHALRAQMQRTARITMAKRFHRAQADVSFRVRRKLEKAITSNTASFTISCEQMAPYVQQFGKHTVTVWIRESLPVYYGVRTKSIREGDRSNGWSITRIG